MSNATAVVHTMTDEVFQPVRLYYTVHNKTAVQVCFKKLRCMDYDPFKDRWTWLYDGEAKKLGFKFPYSDIPVERRPIILGSFYSRVDAQMYLDVPSIERAVAAAEFFDKNLKRMAASIKYCAVLNRITTGADEHPGYCFDKLFGDVRTDDIDQKLEASIEKMTARIKSGRYSDALNDRKFELIEAFPVHFYEEGIDHLRMCLMMRQAVAIMRWKGHSDYCLTDFIAEGIKNMGYVVGDRR